MAYPLTTELIDNFNRANGGIGSGYTALGGGFNVSSNVVVGTAGGTNFVYRNSLTLPVDCEVRMAVPTLPASGQGVRLLLRFNSTTVSGYMLVLYNAGTSFTWYVYRLTNGVTLDLLGSTVTGTTFSAGDEFALQVVGTTIKAFHYTGGAWTEIASRTDSTYSSAGGLAFGTDGTTATLDNLYAGAVTLGGVQAETLDLFTQSAAGTVDGALPDIEGVQNVTLGAISQTAAGDVDNGAINGVQSVTLGGISQTSAGSAPAVTSILAGFIGDSDLDAYRANDNRGGDFASVTFSPTEILVNVLGWDLGTWGTYSEPRRTDYAHVWARSTATLGTVFAGSGSHSVTGDGQHTGLASQIAADDVDTAFVVIGVNDFNLWNGTFQAVYNGTVSGADLTSKINSILDNMETVLDTLISAGCRRILVSNYLDPTDLVGPPYTDPTSLARVSDAVDSVNSGIDSIIAARPQCRLFDRYNWQTTVIYGVSSYTPGVSFDINGETITWTVGDEPHNLILSDNHFGTVFNGLFANALIRAANAEFGTSLPIMSNTDITAAAGLNLPEIEGIQAETLGAISQTSSGEVLVSGVQAETLGGIGQTAAGEVPISGTQTETLGTFSQVSAGIVWETEEGAATLSGSATLTASVIRERTSGSSLYAVGVVTASGMVTRESSASLSGVASLSAAVEAGVTAAASLSGVGGLTASPQRERVFSSALSGVGGLTASPVMVFGGAALLPVVGVLYASVSGIVEGSSLLSGVSSLVSSPSLQVSGGSALPAVSTLTSPVLVVRGGSAAVVGVSGVSGTGVLSRLGSVSLVAVGGVVSAVSVVRSGSAVLPGVGSVLASGILGAIYSPPGERHVFAVRPRSAYQVVGRRSNGTFFVDD